MSVWMYECMNVWMYECMDAHHSWSRYTLHDCSVPATILGELGHTQLARETLG